MWPKFSRYSRNAHRYETAVLSQAVWIAHTNALYHPFQVLLKVRPFQSPGQWDLALPCIGAERNMFACCWLVDQYAFDTDGQQGVYLCCDEMVALPH